MSSNMLHHHTISKPFKFHRSSNFKENPNYYLPLLQLSKAAPFPKIGRRLPIALAPRLEVLHHGLKRIIPRARRSAVKHAVSMILVHVMTNSGEDVDRPVVSLEEAGDLAVAIKIVRHLPTDDIGTCVKDRFGRIDGQALAEGDRVAADGVNDHR